MAESTVLNLCSVEITKDEYFREQRQIKKKEVFCTKESVSEKEFFEGARNGFRPEIKFRLFYGDYSHEQIVEYEGTAYEVYRTYVRSDEMIELYVKRREGTL
jgi:hypothetical protein